MGALLGVLADLFGAIAFALMDENNKDKNELASKE